LEFEGTAAAFRKRALDRLRKRAEVNRVFISASPIKSITSLAR
jgi:hypothetical protein